ncbi:MAG TPA: hypothetical protein PKK57_09595 [Verrucomicrobiota bacterium]|jgi:hypothetical protein|nr:hypothetical protein [Verrucomicrobiota bacterium]HPV10593.1 hypothetical protein [Verrucomicrobiota bacterium]
MKAPRSIRRRRSGKKAPKKLARIGRVLSGDTAEAAAFKKMLAEVVAEAVKSVLEPYLPGLAAAGVQPAGMRGDGIVELGRLRYRPGFEDVWVEGVHYDLRERVKARLCLQYLVEKKAFDARTARYFLAEIDPYVREKGEFTRPVEGRLADYFKDRTGKLRALREELVVPAGRNKRYYLRVD